MTAAAALDVDALFAGKLAAASARRLVGTPVDVLDVRRVPPRDGEGARRERRFVARLQGYGNAFERCRTVSETFRVDVSADPDAEVDREIGRSWQLRHQEDLHASGLRLGIQRPLDGDSLAAGRHLLIDVAAAATLARMLGSAAAARLWVGDALRRIADDLCGEAPPTRQDRTPAARRASADFDGVAIERDRLVVPFLPNPLRIGRGPAPGSRLPAWRGDRLRMDHALPPTIVDAVAGHPVSALTSVFDASPIRDREMLSATASVTGGRRGSTVVELRRDEANLWAALS